MPDLYLCLCERSLNLAMLLSFVQKTRMVAMRHAVMAFIKVDK